MVVRSPFNWWWWWRWCGLIDHNTNYSFSFLRNDKSVWQNKQHFTHTRTHRQIGNKKVQTVEFYDEQRKKMSLNGNTNKSVVRLLIILLCECVCVCDDLQQWMNRIVDIEWDLLLALVTLDSGKPAKHSVFFKNMQLKMFLFLYIIVFKIHPER